MRRVLPAARYTRAITTAQSKKPIYSPILMKPNSPIGALRWESELPYCFDKKRYLIIVTINSNLASSSSLWPSSP